ncbi:monovalent cation/H+ antiporter complex subunit F [Gluconacetobacter takamatsuzukensis]|uniref:Multiple resistance and pH regulation protein F n=1 Tax=Gluconacetobacter takamatsuzukensis TaxID=1286190 RepID=A0A7W4KFV1_9PROT|nr:monovalent cation/H+ antiporter complex subunit F [Gluconacetobacter takamatsuzukensis]MBB2206120.1 hypothetical protein [Gluconacetobacter takamatsuzukensis]
MTIWTGAIVALLVPLGLTIIAARRGRSVRRLAAMQMASFLSAALLVLMTFAQGEPGFMDLPLALALLGLPGSLLIASFYDRFL